MLHKDKMRGLYINSTDKQSLNTITPPWQNTHELKQ